jgi:transcription factor IIIB 90 kDa subunit
MLVDFADVLQTSVYELGGAFLAFTRLFCLKLPLIDPSLYIHRFASKLGQFIVFI